MSTNKKGKLLASLVAPALAAALLLPAGCQAARQGIVEEPHKASVISTADVEEKWGIEIEAMRLTAEGYMLDFRYKVVNPEKAAPIQDRKLQPHVVDAKSGATLIVPAPARVGPLRQAVKNRLPEPDRTYFIMFANPGRLVEAGDRVTVSVGDFSAELTVEQ